MRNRMFRTLLTAGVAGTALFTACNKPPKPDLPFETSNYTRSTTYAEVMEVVRYVDQTMTNAVLDSIGHTVDGKMIPLLVLSGKPVRSPEEARALGRPLIFVMANIHAGEVEGKDAMLRMLLEFSEGRHADLLKQITVLIAPIYNADGNDDFARTNRISQNGPDSVGVRTNRQGYDLNRDYMKMDAPESKALIGNVFTRWDPLLFMDLHTTNGSYHGFHLTYATPLNPNTHPQIVSFQDRVMMPAIKEAMSAKDWRIFEYGNFRRNNPDSGWVTFGAQPRYGTNYYGLRNRMTLLSEAYSYLDFKNRVATTYDFVMSTLVFCAQNANQLNELRHQMDQVYAEYAGGDSLGIAFTFGEPVEQDFVTGTVDTLLHEDIGRMTLRMLPEIGERKIMNYRSFVPVRYEKVPVAYYLDNRDGRLDGALEKLRQHGIAYEEVAEAVDADLDVYVPTQITKAERAFQEHQMVTVRGSWQNQPVDVTGWVKVKTAGPLRNLIFFLIEPATDDGLATWNLYDNVLQQGQPMPLARQTGP